MNALTPQMYLPAEQIEQTPVSIAHGMRVRLSNPYIDNPWPELWIACQNGYYSGRRVKESVEGIMSKAMDIVLEVFGRANEVNTRHYHATGSHLSPKDFEDIYDYIMAEQVLAFS